jgi:cathepsin F
MQLSLILALVVAVSALTDQEQWAAFKAQYKKQYAMGAEEQRFTIFQANLRRAEEYQRQSPLATFGVTQFSDLEPSEFRRLYTGLNATAYKSWHRSLPHAHFPSRQVGADVDWRAKINPVKDQGQCGSCWAFSAVEAIEACYIIKTGKKIIGSPQQVVDCDKSDSGCNGGNPREAIGWIGQTGLCSEADYSYTAKTGTCKSCTAAIPAKECTSSAISTNETLISVALESHPLSIGVDATPLQTYKSGIISGSTCSHSSLDHAILLVGQVGGVWVIQNSWGTSWGEGGYYRAAMGANCLHMNDYVTAAI